MTANVLRVCDVLTAVPSAGLPVDSRQQQMLSGKFVFASHGLRLSQKPFAYL